MKRSFGAIVGPWVGKRAEPEVAEPAPASEPVPAAGNEPEHFPWLCEHCGKPAEIEDVEPRPSDGVLMTYWRCEPCQTWGVTPATLREPPVWVSRKEQ